ncbi:MULTISPECIES: hypothetical protein [unclassified Pseudomonas]|uniref:hypothetical protein n=1 Tax=unclassified Pseudomonas TaxID=196821 RepID=UPI0011AFE376|nr:MULTISPECIES: hypothetical protein [unclassified Pseudomonas]
MDNLRSIRLCASIATIAAVGLGGCTNIDFREPVSSYSKGMALSGAVLSTYYSELNNQARDTYITQAKYDETLPILETDEDGVRTPLVSLFPPEAIKVRLDSIGLISQYGSKLSQLAGSDAPERVGAGVVKLGDSYTKLSDSFAAAAKLGNNDTSTKYVEPVKTIVSVISEKYMDDKRDQLLTEAVEKGYPAVETVLLLLEGDIPLIHQWAVNQSSNQLSRASTYYNENKSKMSFEQRSALLDQISKYSKNYQELTVNQPTDVVVAMREVNAALLTYARNPKDENRIVRLTSEIDTFNSRVGPIAEAIIKMRSN